LGEGGKEALSPVKRLKTVQTVGSSEKKLNEGNSCPTMIPPSLRKGDSAPGPHLIIISVRIKRPEGRERGTSWREESFHQKEKKTENKHGVKK